MKTTLRLLSMLVAFIMLSLSVCTPLYAVTAVAPDTDGSAENAQSLENATENEAVFEELQNFDTIVSERLSSAELATAVLDTSEIPAAMSGSTEAIERKDHVKRLFSEEKGLHSVVFQNRDDTTTEYIFSRPVKYVDENGNIRDKSTDIRVNSDNSGFAADDNTVRSYFSNALNDGICIGFGEYEVEFSPSSYVSKGSVLVNTTLPGDRSTRERVAYVISPDIIMYYTPTLEGLKEDIVLNSYTGVNSFAFTYMTDGLSMTVNAYGEVELKNESGNTVGKLNRVVCYDSDGKTSYGSVSVTEITPNAEYTVTVTADADFLASTNTVYPVSIDPSVAIYNVYTDDDTSENLCYIENLLLCNNEDTVDWYSGSTYVPVGTGEYDISGDITRMIYRFGSDFYHGDYSYLPYELESKTIHSAELVIQTYVGDVNRTIYAVPWYGEWPEDADGDGLVYCSSASVFNNYDDMYCDATALSAEFEGEKSYDITQALTEMFYDYSNGGSYSATAIMFYNSNESSDGDGDYVEMPLGSNPGEPSNFRISIDYSNFETTNNYIISNHSGKFLHYDTQLLEMDTYANASASNADRWIFYYLGNDTYRIWSNGRYLTASGSTVTMSLTSNTDAQKWYIPPGANGIKNVSTGTYLRETSTGLSLASFITNDRTFLWSVYHNTDYVPATDFELEDDWIPTGVAKTLKIRTSPEDATNIIGNGSYNWYVSSTAFSITQGATCTVAASAVPGTATLTVTHTPTGITKSFRIYRGAVREGTYMIRNRQSKRYMQVVGGALSDGARIEQWTYHTSPHAKWNIIMLSNGYYAIQSYKSSKYLRVANDNPAAVANIDQGPDCSVLATHWNILPTTKGAFKIVPRANANFAMTIPANDDYNGTYVIQNTYTNDTNYIDEWYIDPGTQTHGIVDGRVYNIMVNNGGNKYLTVAGEGTPTASGGGLADGSNIMQYAIENGAHQWQRWQMIYVNDGLYKIKDMNSGKLLTIKDDSSLIQANIQIEADTDSSGQFFKIRENIDGSYSFLSECSDFTKVLDINNYSKQNGANLEQYYDNGTSNQKFMLKESNKAIIIIPGILGSELYVGEDNPYFYESMPLFSEEIINALKEYESQLNNDPEIFQYLPEWLCELIREINDTDEFIDGVYDSLKCNTDGSGKYDLYVKEFRNTLPNAEDASKLYSSRVGMCNIYSTIYNTLVNNFSSDYVVDFFSYDWRMSNGESAQKLDAYIERYGYDKVVLISHSMGGLVSSGYIAMGTEQQNKIEKAFFAASPLLGAAESLNVLFNEDLSFLQYSYNNTSIDINMFRLIADIFFIEGSNCIENLLCNYQSIYELFPTNCYYNQLESYLTFVNVKTFNTTTEPCLSNAEVKEVLDECYVSYNNNLMLLAEDFHDICFTNSGIHVSSLVSSYYLCGTEQLTSDGLTLTKDDSISCAGQEVTLVISYKHVFGDGLVLQRSATAGLSMNSSNVFWKEGNHMAVIKLSDFIDYIIDNI